MATGELTSRALAGRPRMVAAIIFDLDHTLFDPRQIPADVFGPMVQALRSANIGPDALSDDRLEAAVAACWLRSFDDVAREFAIPVAAQAAWIAASRSVHIAAPLQPYPDVDALNALPVRRFLVTTGHRGVQESKVAALGIASLFEDIYFDALDVPNARSDKESLFRHLLRATSLAATDVAVVGDSPHSEIAAGRRLGMLTIQIRRDTARDAGAADHLISDLSELPRLLGL